MADRVSSHSKRKTTQFRGNGVPKTDSHLPVHQLSVIASSGNEGPGLLGKQEIFLQGKRRSCFRATGDLPSRQREIFLQGNGRSSFRAMDDLHLGQQEIFLRRSSFRATGSDFPEIFLQGNRRSSWGDLPSEQHEIFLLGIFLRGNRGSYFMAAWDLPSGDLLLVSLGKSGLTWMILQDKTTYHHKKD